MALGLENVLYTILFSDDSRSVVTVLRASMIGRLLFSGSETLSMMERATESGRHRLQGKTKAPKVARCHPRKEARIVVLLICSFGSFHLCGVA